MTADPLAQATELHATLDSAPDLRTLLPLLEPLLEALRAREGLLPWIVAVDPADRPGFRDDFATGFSVFWTNYPVKVGKLKAKQAAWKAARRGDWPGWEAVCLAVEAQKESPRWKGGTIPNPSTWFNGGRWDDDPATMTAIGGNGNGKHDEPPAGYLYTRSERQSWPRLEKWERRTLLENIGHEQARRRMLQEEGREEYWTP